MDEEQTAAPEPEPMDFGGAPEEQAQAQEAPAAPAEDSVENPSDRAGFEGAMARLKSAAGQGRKIVADTDQMNNDAMDAFATGQGGAIKAQKDFEDKYLKPAGDEMARLDAEHQDVVAKRVELRTKLTDQLNQIDEMGKQLATQQPQDFWADKSTWQKVLGLAAVGLGGAPVAEQIDNTIKRDMMMQKLKLQNGQQAYENKRLFLNQFINTTDHIQEAEDHAYLAATNAVKARIQVLADGSKSPQMKAAAIKTLADMQQKAAGAHERVATNAMGQDIRAANDEASAYAKLLAARSKGAGKAAQSNTLGELRGFEPTNPNVKFIGDPKKEGVVLRGLQTSTQNFTGALGELQSKIAAFKNAKINGLMGGDKADAYNELQSAIAKVITKSKAKEFGNAGSRLTDMQKKMDEQAFGAGHLMATFKPEMATKIINETKLDVIKDFLKSAENRGLKPTKEYLEELGLKVKQ